MQVPRCRLRPLTRMLTAAEVYLKLKTCGGGDAREKNGEGFATDSARPEHRTRTRVTPMHHPCATRRVHPCPISRINFMGPLRRQYERRGGPCGAYCRPTPAALQIQLENQYFLRRVSHLSSHSLLKHPTPPQHDSPSPRVYTLATPSPTSPPPSFPHLPSRTTFAHLMSLPPVTCRPSALRRRPPPPMSPFPHPHPI